MTRMSADISVLIRDLEIPKAIMVRKRASFETLIAAKMASIGLIDTFLPGPGVSQFSHNDS